jgi:hypothetical protein
VYGDPDRSCDERVEINAAIRTKEAEDLDKDLESMRDGQGERLCEAMWDLCSYHRRVRIFGKSSSTLAARMFSDVSELSSDVVERRGRACHDARCLTQET